MKDEALYERATYAANTTPSLGGLATVTAMIQALAGVYEDEVFRLRDLLSDALPYVNQAWWNSERDDEMTELENLIAAIQEATGQPVEGPGV